MTGGTATFDDENVGNGKTVTLTGVDAGRRRRRQLHADVGGDDDGRHHGAARHGQFTAANKVYDGNDDGDGR